MTTEIPHYFTNAGRTIRRNGSVPDCVCRAITLLTSLAYDEVSAFLAEHTGYKPGRSGVSVRCVLRRFPIIGSTHFVPYFDRADNGTNGSTITLARFIRENPKGDFLCRISGHAFVVSNGEVFDSRRLRGTVRITNAWEARPAK